MAGRRVRRLRPILAALLAPFAVWVSCSLSPRSAEAVEAFDGRVEVHGFGEIQMRAIDRDFSEQLDLAQWYNIFNAEFEFDFAPDGLGPIDLFQAFVRVEARFDCVWSRGCGMLRSANTYGNRAKRLPDRLSDAIDPDYSGNIPPPPGVGGNPRHPRPEPAGFEPFREADLDGNGGEIIKDSGFPGFDTLFRQKGPDTYIQSGDEPGVYTFENFLDFRFGLLKVPDQAAGGTRIIGPWLPKNVIGHKAPIELVGNAALRDRANPFRGRFGSSGGERFHERDRPLSPEALLDLTDSSRGAAAGNFEDAYFPGNVSGTNPTGEYEDTLAAAVRLDRLDPEILAQLDQVGPQLNPAGGSVARSFWLPPGGPNGQDSSAASAIAAPLKSEYVALRHNGSYVFRNNNVTVDSQNTLKPSVELLFGGDFNPTIPCARPDPNVLQGSNNNSIKQVKGDSRFAFCFPDGSPNPDFADLVRGPDELNTKTNQVGFGSNRRIRGGRGENPFRPAPDIGLFGSILPGDDGTIGTADDIVVSEENADLHLAQGLYYPSRGLIRELDRGQLDNPDVNYTELERAFNRGQSQQDEGELKEAYVDLEFLDSRLWARIGLQSIVWGKTELFRTTDQFNPQDFALSTLPGLEESRIGLWSARFIYSLYDVWEFEDVRLEFAFNFDNYQPADLGACGEPYTLNVACGIPFGLAAHSGLGIGLAGVDRPDNPWDNFKGLEFGGRIEWRWSRFSFAVTDFLGYSDFPYIDVLFTYERNVDPTSGRARWAENTVIGSCLTNSANTNDNLDSDSRTVNGVGTGPGCLQPGGAAGEVNANGLADDGAGTLRHGEDPSLSPHNALYWHPANQQLFAVICSATVTISLLDPSSCALNIFASREPLSEVAIPPLPLVEVLSVVLAGEPDRTQKDLIVLIPSNATGDKPDMVPVVNLNRENPSALLDPVGRPGVTIGAAGLNPGLASTPTYPLIDDRLPPSLRNSVRTPLSLDSTLTREQSALLGCGPFWGTRCDHSGTVDGQFSFTGGGGIDFLNTDASVLLQSFPGVEGTGVPGLNGFEEGDLWSTFDSKFTQPGTIGFDGGPVGTVYAPGLDFIGVDALGGTGDLRIQADPRGLVHLPGSRGPITPDDLEAWGLPRDTDPVTINEAAQTITIRMQPGYNPLIDGCFVEPTMTYRSSTLGVPDVVYDVKLEELDGATGTFRPTSRANDVYCASGYASTREGGGFTRHSDVDHAATLWHPLAGCMLTDSQVAGLVAIAFAGEPTPTLDPLFPCKRPGSQLGDLNNLQPPGPNQVPFRILVDGALLFADPELVRACGDWVPFFTLALCGPRDFESEFIDGLLAGTGGVGGRAQIFNSELAALSWNFVQLLVVTSCNEIDDVKATDLDCFDASTDDNIYDNRGRCSFAAPHFCRNVKGFLSLGGVSSPEIRAGGNGRFGRRTFGWHGGQEATLRYNRRNVLGFSLDFAEDISKSSWGIEFTWIEGSPFSNSAEVDHITRQDTINLTISADRPTFINFMNANRTFFFNSQWFFQYQTDYQDTFLANGPVNVLFTFAMFTGYYQDRLLPRLITVYDFNSQSGGILPNITYRFNDRFSIDWGLFLFFGRTQKKPMDISSIGPPSNRAGPDAYTQPVDNLLSLVRDRDEVFLKLRYTF